MQNSLKFLFIACLLFHIGFAQQCKDCYPNSCGCSLFPCSKKFQINSTSYISQGIPNGNNTKIKQLVDIDFLIFSHGNCPCSYLRFTSSNCSTQNNTGLFIASDIDLKQYSLNDTRKLNLSSALIEKIQPFLQKSDMYKYCRSQNFSRCHVELTESENREINEKIILAKAQKIRAKYNSEKPKNKNTTFENLPYGLRTVIVSVFYFEEYQKYRAFWLDCLNENWDSALTELLKTEQTNLRKAEVSAFKFSLILPCIPKDPRYQVMFILDSSGSIGGVGYEQEKQFVYDLCNSWKIGEENIRVAIIIFSSTVQTITDFTGNKGFLLQTIKQIPYLQGSTATGDAIRQAIPYFVNNKAGPAAPRMLFLLTDGWSNMGENVSTAARDIKSQDVNCFAIGVGSDVRREEMEVIASRPENIYNVTSFAKLSTIFDDLSKSACYSPAILNFTKNSTETAVPVKLKDKTIEVKAYKIKTTIKESTTYFQSSYKWEEGCTFYYHSENSDNIRVYYSQVNQNPSPEFCQGQAFRVNKTTWAFNIPPKYGSKTVLSTTSTTSTTSNTAIYYSIIKEKTTQNVNVDIENTQQSVFSASCSYDCLTCDFQNTTCYEHKKVAVAPQNITHPPKNITHPPKNITHPPKNITHPPKNITHPPKNITHPPQNVSTQPQNCSCPPQYCPCPPQYCPCYPQYYPYPPQYYPYPYPPQNLSYPSQYYPYPYPPQNFSYPSQYYPYPYLPQNFSYPPQNFSGTPQNNTAMAQGTLPNSFIIIITCVLVGVIGIALILWGLIYNCVRKRRHPRPPLHNELPYGPEYEHRMIAHGH